MNRRSFFARVAAVAVGLAGGTTAAAKPTEGDWYDLSEIRYCKRRVRLRPGQHIPCYLDSYELDRLRGRLRANLGPAADEPITIYIRGRVRIKNPVTITGPYHRITGVT